MAQTGRITVPGILAKKLAEKITALTAYDAAMARLIDRAGADIILVGDSLGCVVQGHETTIPVTIDEVIYHSKCVSRVVERSLVVGDLPFLSYQVSPEQALLSAGRLIKEGGVSAVKLEGGVHMASTIERLVNIDIPVMGHIGLTPQSYHRMGGNKVQGKKSGNSAGSRKRILADAQAVQAAGAFAVVIESVPAELASEITEELNIPTIGIGAGPGCDGQVLVTHDMLGMLPDFAPRFVKRYAELHTVIDQAVKNFSSEVRSGGFPTLEHSFGGDRAPFKPKLLRGNAKR